MAIKRKTKKDADEWLDQQKVSDGKTRIAMKKAYIEGRLSNLTDAIHSLPLRDYG